MFNVISLDKNKIIIEQVLRWRCLTLDTIEDLVLLKQEMRDVRQRVYRLEKYGFFKSKRFMNSKKVIYPNPEFLNYLGTKKQQVVNEDNLKHDSYVSSVCSSLLQFGHVQKVYLPHEYNSKNTWNHKTLNPDAIMEIEQDGNKFQIALEVELHRKEKSRIYEKMTDYAKAEEFDYVFYFFADEFAFNSYTNRIEEISHDENYSFIHQEIKSKVVLLLLDTPKTKIKNLGGIKVLADGKFKTLDKLLGIN